MSGWDPGLPGVPDPKVNHPGNITIYVARKKWEYDLEAAQYTRDRQSRVLPPGQEQLGMPKTRGRHPGR